MREKKTYPKVSFGFGFQGTHIFMVRTRTDASTDRKIQSQKNKPYNSYICTSSANKQVQVDEKGIVYLITSVLQLTRSLNIFKLYKSEFEKYVLQCFCERATSEQSDFLFI